MSAMFGYSTDFDQDISAWNVALVQRMDDMFAGAGLSTANYDALLTGWSTQDLKSNVPFDGGGSQYSAGPPAAARQTLVNTFGWEITDGGLAP
jgi:hypothetical protein